MFPSRARSTLLSAAIHTGAVALLFLAATHPRLPDAMPRIVSLVEKPLAAWIPETKPARESGGGGGGRSVTPASAGVLPRIAPRQFTPPAAEVHNEAPRLVMEPTLVGNAQIVLPSDELARLGLPAGVAGPPSDGNGSGGGIGNGKGQGVGDGAGPGFGPGNGGMVSGRAPQVGRISGPVVLWMVEPEYTDEARRAKVQGTVVLYIEIDGSGRACNFQVQQSLGLGLDERAVEAVRRWKFRPGSRDGVPIATTARVEVNFRLL